MEQCSYEQDKIWSETFNDDWDNYYKSVIFFNLLQKLRKRGKVEITNIDRDDNPIFQKETYLDVVLSLSTGSSLLIDEKMLRYPRRILEFPDNINQFPIEVCSNPNAGGKHDGWGYHIGTTIVMVHATPLGDAFVDDPVVFTITQKFVDDVVRNNNYPTFPVRSTNGLYRSVCKWISRRVLDDYFP